MSSVRFTDLIALSFAASTVLLSPREARACASDDPNIEETTTFDPSILDDATPEGLFWDPYHAGFGGACADCAEKEMVADWAAHLGPNVKPDDWRQVLLEAKLPEVDALIFKLQKKKNAVPPSFAASSVLKVSSADAEKVIAALYFLGFARRVEPFAAPLPPSWDDRGVAEAEKKRKAAGDPLALQQNGEKVLSKAKDDFLRQRYAFQLLRLRFYRKDWPGVIAWYRDQEKALAAPSDSLPWRARYYLAGALRRSGDVPRANLELARIHASFPPLAAAAAEDFRPLEAADWKACLALAANVREKTLLWRLVGLKLDGQPAMTEIAALDPASDLLPLLAVREVARREGEPKELATLEKIIVRLADAPSTNRRFVFDLVAAHAAALRGDLATTRTRIDRAMKARPNDRRVANQAHASLALALAGAWKAPDAKLEDELSKTMAAIDSGYSRSDVVRRRVRDTLARGLLAAGKKIDAELMVPGSASRTPQPGRTAPSPWRDPAFIEALIARVSKPSSAFDRFLVDGSGHTRPKLEQELALLHLVNGDFDAAKRTFETTTATSARLFTDPFVLGIRDCHDCDHEKYGPTSTWTHKSFAARLAELKKEASGTGEPAAKAALLLGNALYNVTWYGNARVVLADTHLATADTKAAEEWYQRAHDLTKDRELKAKAAFMAAKCELAEKLESPDPKVRGDGNDLPIPSKWFPIVRSFGDTKYHREILAECGHYRRWSEKQPK